MDYELRAVLKFDTMLRNHSGAVENLQVPLTYHLLADRINTDPAVMGEFATLDLRAGTIHVPPVPVHRSLFNPFLRPLVSQDQSGLTQALGLKGVSAQKQQFFGRLIMDKVERALDGKPRKAGYKQRKDKVLSGKVYRLAKPSRVTPYSPQLTASESPFVNETNPINIPSSSSNPRTLPPTSTPYGSPVQGTYQPDSPRLPDPFHGLQPADNDPLQGLESLDLHNADFFQPNMSASGSSSSTEGSAVNAMDTDA